MRNSRLPSVSPEIERLIELLAKTPGLGRRSAQRAALALLKKRDGLMLPLAQALNDAAEKVKACSECGSLDTLDPCAICSSKTRDDKIICVVADMGDVWALERASVFRGKYHVLGGVLSALDGVRPEDLRVGKLVERASHPDVREVVIALNNTVDGQTTAHYLTERLQGLDIAVTRLAHGLPVGGELGLLDDGTLLAALSSRRPF